MSYHPRIESAKIASFLTTRARNSELWFANNQPLEQAILGYTAKFAERYDVKLYALAIEGNHVQGPAHFPKANRSNFMRDLNSCIARAVPKLTPNYPGGRFWQRRYSSEFMPGNEDIEDRFFYTVLQPVQDGHVSKISDYPYYNCFHDAIYGIKRKFKVVRWAEYNAARRYNPNVQIKTYTDIVELKFERLPGYESFTQKDYAELMLKKLEERRQEIVQKRMQSGKNFAGASVLLKVKCGSRPHSTKTSSFSNHRPRVLSVSHERRAECKNWYFKTYSDYREASKKYRDGDLDVIFPEGTYRPFYHPPPLAA